MFREKSLLRRVGLSAALLSAVSMLTLVSCGAPAETTEVTTEAEGQKGQMSDTTTEAGSEGADKAATTTEQAAADTSTSSSEATASQGTETTGEALSSDEVLDDKLKEAMRLKEEYQEEYNQVSKRLAERQKLYSELEAKLNSLRESEGVDSAKQVVSSTKIDSELQLLRRDFATTQQDIKAGFADLKPELIATTKALAGAEEEFKGLREFGSANIGREILLYLFGLKFI